MLGQPAELLLCWERGNRGDEEERGIEIGREAEEACMVMTGPEAAAAARQRSRCRVGVALPESDLDRAESADAKGP